MEPVYNERGVIAESYHDLQGLGVLEAMRQAHPLPKASAASTLRSIFQGVEIALLNLNDVISRAAGDLKQGNIEAAWVKVAWARGFHRVLTRLSMLPNQLGVSGLQEAMPGHLKIADSPAFREYLTSVRRFDESLAALLDSGPIDLPKVLSNSSLESVAFNLIHTLRICNHESTIWEQNLADVMVPANISSYEEFVVSAEMRHAVYERVLKGDSYFTQFRGLHQIPETLGEEANDHCEQVIRLIRADELQKAVEHLRTASLLIDAMLVTVPPMADNLSTADYHQIRENLGLTSGSHSVCLRFHMFNDLYEQLWAALVVGLTSKPHDQITEEEIIHAIRTHAQARSNNHRSWLLHMLANECLGMRASLFLWRDQHQHLPRNNLGGGRTKSLTGAPDAVRTVAQMRNTARNNDPMAPLLLARGLSSSSAPVAQLKEYFDSDGSIDARILMTTGSVTQARFVQVQERLGFFANRCPFRPPAKRTVI